MNEIEFDEKYLAITKFQRPVLTHFLGGDSDIEIADKLNSNKENVRQHISKICQTFNIKNAKGESWRLREDLVTIFIRNKPELVGRKWLDKLSPHQAPIDFPGGAISLNSLLYIERELLESRSKKTIEDDIKVAIVEPRALIRILGPSKFGKTSLSLRIEAHAKSHNFRTAYINIKQEFDQERFENLEVFMQCLCNIFSERVDSFSEISWQSRLTPQMNCTRHIEMLLNQSESPILLILDGVEALYSVAKINQEFFQMLRRWHDNGASKEAWKSFRQIIAYSSENYGITDLSRSPFNIGRHYELPEFNESDILGLGKKYQLDSDSLQLQKISSLVGGNPYLISLALYHLSTNKDLLSGGITNEILINSIYQEYLASLVNYLERNSELMLALQQILNPKEGRLRLDDRLRHILYSMGIIKNSNSNSNAQIRCDLYQQYFEQHYLSQLEN